MKRNAWLFILMGTLALGAAVGLAVPGDLTTPSTTPTQLMKKDINDLYWLFVDENGQNRLAALGALEAKLEGLQNQVSSLSATLSDFMNAARESYSASLGAQEDILRHLLFGIEWQYIVEVLPHQGSPLEWGAFLSLGGMGSGEDLVAAQFLENGDLLVILKRPVGPRLPLTTDIRD